MFLAPVGDSKTTAVFDEVQPEQAGVYTCKATNWAGTVYKDVDFLVLSGFRIINLDKLNLD